ncbi:hypothetical protein HN51_007874, partial [Arachis hypogaea]
ERKGLEGNRCDPTAIIIMSKRTLAEIESELVERSLIEVKMIIAVKILSIPLG